MATLTCADITAAYFRQKDMFSDVNLKADYIAEVNAAKAIIENTTAKIEYLTDADKKRTARIYWNKFCDSTVATTTPDFCTITGAEADAACKDYAITLQASKGFVIDEASYETNNLNVIDVFADNMLKVKKFLDEHISKAIVSAVDSFSSPNLYTTTGIGCPGQITPSVSWAQTLIPPSLWTPDLMNYFQIVSRVNKFASPFLLDGKNLSSVIWKAMMNAGNGNGSGAANMVKLVKYYEDLINVEAVSAGKTFLIDRGSVAFVNRNRWVKATAQNPIQENLRIKYSEASQNIPGLNYDVYITETCSGAYKKWNVLLHTFYDVFNAPTNCNGGTGVLEFKCGACL